jgi:hypothetical protein
MPKGEAGEISIPRQALVPLWNIPAALKSSGHFRQSRDSVRKSSWRRCCLHQRHVGMSSSARGMVSVSPSAPRQSPGSIVWPVWRGNDQAIVNAVTRTRLHESFLHSFMLLSSRLAFLQSIVVTIFSNGEIRLIPAPCPLNTKRRSESVEVLRKHPSQVMKDGVPFLAIPCQHFRKRLRMPGKERRIEPAFRLGGKRQFVTELTEK